MRTRGIAARRHFARCYLEPTEPLVVGAGQLPLPAGAAGKGAPEPQYEPAWTEVPKFVPGGEGDEGEGDPLLDKALEVVREHGTASASMLQRKLRVGYNRAARLIEQLEEEGIIGPSQGAAGRTVLGKPPRDEDDLIDNASILAKRWFFKPLLKSDIIAVVAGTTTYQLPTDFEKPNGLLVFLVAHIGSSSPIPTTPRAASSRSRGTSRPAATR